MVNKVSKLHKICLSIIESLETTKILYDNTYSRICKALPFTTCLHKNPSQPIHPKTSAPSPLPLSFQVIFSAIALLSAGDRQQPCTAIGSFQRQIRLDMIIMSDGCCVVGLPLRRMVEGGRGRLLYLQQNPHWMHLVIRWLHLGEFNQRYAYEQQRLRMTVKTTIRSHLLAPRKIAYGCHRHKISTRLLTNS